MVAELTVSQTQVELLQTTVEVHNANLSTNGQQIQVLHTRLSTTEDEVQNLDTDFGGN